MSKYCVTNGNLYNDGLTTELLVHNGADLRVQATGTGSYKVTGKLTANGVSKPLELVKLSDFSCVEVGSNNEIYAADVSGFYSVSVSDVQGVTEIYATILEG